MKTPRKMNFLLTCVCLVVFASPMVGQNTLTFYRQFGTGADDFAFGVALDATGVYIIGCKNDADAALPPAKPCEGDLASADAFVRKYDTAGVQQWEDQFGTPLLNEVARAVAADSSGVYVAGYTHDPATTDANAFVRKYNASGTLLWEMVMGTVLPDFAFGVAVDATGVYVTGFTKGDFTNPLLGTSAGLSDIFVAKFDLNSGTPLWLPAVVRQYDIGTLSTDAAFGVAADGLAFYIAGSTGAGAGQADAFVRKYDAATGTVLSWSTEFGGGTDDAAFSVGQDSSAVYVAGCLHDGNSDGSCDSGNADAFVQKYDKSSGTLLWNREFGSTDESGNPGPFDSALSVTTDVTGVYVGGYTDGQLPGQTVSGNSDAFVRKYNLNGNELWTTQFGGVPSTSADLTWGVVAASSSGVFASGYTNGTMPTQVPLGGFDAFLVKNPRFRVNVGGPTGSFATIRLGSNGIVPVAILGTTTFDATTVDPLSITLAGATVKLRGNGTYQASAQDVNGDGLMDLVVHVTTEALQLSETDTEAVLEGTTFSGQAIRGAYLVRIVP